MTQETNKITNGDIVQLLDQAAIKADIPANDCVYAFAPDTKTSVGGEAPDRTGASYMMRSGHYTLLFAGIYENHIMPEALFEQCQMDRANFKRTVKQGYRGYLDKELSKALVCCADVLLGLGWKVATVQLQRDKAPMTMFWNKSQDVSIGVRAVKETVKRPAVKKDLVQ